MTSSETFQVPLETAEIYERRFVPALFADWAGLLVDAADPQPGDTVLDVACGTGIVARTAASRTPRSRVTGVDLNEAMLAVARRVAPELDWRLGDVAALPFPDGAFDVVLCQMALMFFPDRVAALREMARVAGDRATVGLVVPAALEDQPAYGPFVDVAARHAGPEAAALLGAYWACGDLEELTGWCATAGLDVVAVHTRSTVAGFASPDDLVATEVEGSPLAARIDAGVYERIRVDAARVLEAFVDRAGRFAPPLVGHVVIARPGARRPDRRP